jgi:hypothetical protein
MRVPTQLLCRLVCLLLLAGIALASAAATADEDFAPIAAGPIFDKFGLTLQTGTRTEALGPFYYHQQTAHAKTWGVPPLFAITDSQSLDARDVAILPPLLSYHRYGTQSTLMITPLLTFYGGDYQNDVTRQRTMFFPFYFRQKSSNPDLRYLGIFPFYGTVKGIFQRTEARWVMAPLFIESWKRDVHTKNYLYPIFHTRTGNGLTGWQFWPFYGTESKVPTTRTNDFGDVRVIPGFEKRFALWPMFFWEDIATGTTNATTYRGYWPAYTALKSPQVEATTAFFSLYSHTEDRAQKYEQWGFPWPIWLIARGEGKHVTRFIPFYNYGSNNIIQSRAYLWPGYVQRTLDTGPALITRTRVMLYLWSEVKEEIKETHEVRRRQNAWPFMTRMKYYDGSTRLQVFAPLEPMLPSNETVERVFSPLWSVWRSQYNATNGASSQSLLWNLYRHDSTADLKRWSLLYGLFQGRQTKDEKRLRLFFIPLKPRGAPVYSDFATLVANAGNPAVVPSRKSSPPPAPSAVKRSAPSSFLRGSALGTRGATLLLPPSSPQAAPVPTQVAQALP